MTQETQKSPGKIIGPLIGGILGFAIVTFLVVKMFHGHSSGAEEGINKDLVEVANELNKSCPMMVDSITRLDNAVALPNNIFQYNYTLISIRKTDLNPEELRMRLEPGMTNTIRTNPQLKYFSDRKVTMAYNYNDKNGEFVLNIPITPDKYLGSPERVPAQVKK
jgi:hypothetical protein